MRVRAEVVQGRSEPRTIELDAGSLADAQQQARSLGYTVLSCRAAGIGLRQLFAPAVRRSGAVEVTVFIEQLRDLLVAGLSVIEAVNALRRGAAAGHLQRALELLEQALSAGHPLSEALSRQPDFPVLLVALVRSSELTSDLPQTLTRFLEHERRVAELRHRLVSVAIYPLLVTVIGAMVLLFLLFYVMPRFARVFDGITGELPGSARAMVAWAQLLHQHSTLFAAFVALLVFAAATVAGTPSVRSAATRWLLARVSIKRRMTAYILARWYRATGMLVTGGIALPESLELSNEVLPASLRATGAAVSKNVRDGLSPSAAYVKAHMATAVAEQLLLAGERTGDLGTVLTRIAQFHESEVSRGLERTMRALEPIVMVVIGLGVGAVVVLMYLPIFELAAAIQ